MLLVLVLGFCFLPGAGALLPAPSSLQTAGLSATGRRQIFTLGLAELVKEAQESRLVLRHPPSHNLPLMLSATAPAGLVPQLSCTSRLPEPPRHRERMSTCPREVAVCTNAAGGTWPNSSDFRGTRPVASPAAPAPRQGSGKASDSAHRPTKSLFST